MIACLRRFRRHDRRRPLRKQRRNILDVVITKIFCCWRNRSNGIQCTIELAALTLLSRKEL